MENIVELCSFKDCWNKNSRRIINSHFTLLEINKKERTAHERKWKVAREKKSYILWIYTHKHTLIKMMNFLKGKTVLVTWVWYSGRVRFNSISAYWALACAGYSFCHWDTVEKEKKSQFFMNLIYVRLNMEPYTNIQLQICKN